MPLTWFELTLEVPRRCSDAVANFLMESGAPGVQIDEHACTTVLTAHFERRPPREAIRRFCTALGCSAAQLDHSRIRRVADENWAETWKAHFEPQPVGQKLYICPPWQTEPPPGRVAIVINPGMAFGTGHHATTRSCLELLEDVVRTAQVARALDVGTGSGILAVALAKLGVPDVWAVDTDPLACTIAAANAERNGVAACIRVTSRLGDASGTFDLVTANLFANVLQELAPRLVAALAPGGILICSGLLVDDDEAVNAAYRANRLRLRRRSEAPPWVTLELQRDGSV